MDEARFDAGSDREVGPVCVVETIRVVDSNCLQTGDSRQTLYLAARSNFASAWTGAAGAHRSARSAKSCEREGPQDLTQRL